MMLIRKADATDSALLAQLHSANFSRGWSKAEFLSFFERSGVVALIAENPQPSGFIFCWVIADDCELLSLAVNSGMRQQGIAKGLCERAFEEARALGAKQILLEVAQSNQAAIALYKAYDFTMSHRRKDYYLYPDGTREDALTMSKRL
jgi:[ribosomal protein S18]-alanine N-acetyltransferase